MRCTVVVAVDVGKTSVALSVTDASRLRLFGPVDFVMIRPELKESIARVQQVLPREGQIEVGVEAAGHYDWPLPEPSAWPPGWEVLELNPAHVAEQRQVAGRRRVKTEAIDLEAITELVRAGREAPAASRDSVFGELAGRAAHRHRRVAARMATKKQLLGQLNRTFPGWPRWARAEYPRPKTTSDSISAATRA